MKSSCLYHPRTLTVNAWAHLILFFSLMLVVFISEHTTQSFKVELKVNIQLEAKMQNKVVTLA